MVVVHGESLVLVGDWCGGDVVWSFGERRLVIVDLDDKAAIVKGNLVGEQVFQKFMGHRLPSQVMKKGSHG